VTVSDSKPQEQLSEEIPILLDHGIIIETGGHGERTFHGQDLIVVSPGVPADSPPLVQARALGEPVIGEIELAAQFLPKNIVAITGSNGKTTTTTLTGEIITAGGYPTRVGGNIGTPAISLVDAARPDSVIVLEVSSFQLETIQTFRPKVAVVLNVTPDHLDRHRTFETYVDAKARIFENQHADDFAVLNADDPVCVELSDRTRAQVFWFSRKKEVQQGASLRDGRILFRDSSGQQEIMVASEIPLKGAHNLENTLAAICAGALMKCAPERIRAAVRNFKAVEHRLEYVAMVASEIPLKGAHNLENTLAAICAGALMKCAPERIRAAVRNFKAVEHRLEYVATIRGVEYYNDSKATNVDATIKALESFPANIHLILGGKDKGSDYTVLNDLLRQRVKRVYTIGAAADKIESQVREAAEIVHAESLDSAVQRASASAQPGDVVLLAPACASFDQFRNYEHRGKVFKELVQRLSGKETV